MCFFKKSLQRNLGNEWYFCNNIQFYTPKTLLRVGFKKYLKQTLKYVRKVQICRASKALKHQIVAEIDHIWRKYNNLVTLL